LVFYFLIEAGEGRVVSGLSLAFERTGVLRSVPGELRRIDEVEFQSLLEGGAVVVDARERELYARGHRDGAINLPLQALQLRAAVEILPAPAVIVDCYRGWEGMCDMAGRTLRLVGVPDVAVFVHGVPPSG
jgi:rhodanese-related sulfurtransferase